MKKIAKFIIEEESKKEGIDVDVSPVTFVEWYKKDDFTKWFKLSNFSDKIMYTLRPLTNLGINYTTSKKIYIFLNNFKCYKFLGLSHQLLVDLLNILYHEFAHSYQRFKNDDYDIYQFYVMFFERYLINNNYAFYTMYHDRFFKERDADYYAIKKTSSFLKKYPQLYKKNKKYINSTAKTNEINYVNYDFQFIFEAFFQTYTKNLIKNIKDINNSFFEIFFEKDSNQFKSIKGIKNAFPQNLQFFYQILTSKPFLEQLNVNTLDNIEKDLLLNAILYSIDIETKKQKKNATFINENLSIFQYYLVAANLKANQEKIDYLVKILKDFFAIEYVDSTTKSKT